METSIYAPKKSLKGTKRLFLKLGTCSQTLFHILNREFENPNNVAGKALDPLAGGILQKGHQCGMLWGASLAVGSEAYRQANSLEEAIRLAVIVTRKIMDSFVQQTDAINCREITKCDWSSIPSVAKHFVTGRVFYCFNLAEKWAPEAIQSAKEALSQDESESPGIPISCATQVARKMGGTEEEMVMVAGFAGGLGLSGEGCGALAAAIWINSLKWCEDHPGKSGYANPNSKAILEEFKNLTRGEMLCQKITSKKFSTLEEHTEFMKGGGCEELCNGLSQST